LRKVPIDELKNELAADRFCLRSVYSLLITVAMNG
jgi:hypothetical protein